MSSESSRPSDRRKRKESRVLELHDQGWSYRRIVKEVQLSLRDVTKYIQRVSNKTKSLSTTSVMDEVILEYRVNELRHEVRDLEIRKANLNNELTSLHARIMNLDDLFDAKQSKIDKAIKEKVDSIIHDRGLIFTMSFPALIEALRNHPNIKLLILFDLIMSQDIVCDSELRGKSLGEYLKGHQFVVVYYNKLMPLYEEYFTKIMEITHAELMRSYQLIRV
jgi:hypothetical protein